MLVWQVSHCAFVGTWNGALPNAIVPLWQVEQRPEVEASCTMVLIGRNAPVVWQASQLAVVVGCRGLVGFPDASTPLWQRAHWLCMTVECFISAGIQLFCV